MGGDDDGRPPGVRGVEEVHHLEGPLGVEVAGGLVGEEEGGIAHQRPRHGHPLLLAAGEGGRELVGPVLEATERSSASPSA